MDGAATDCPLQTRVGIATGLVVVRPARGLLWTIGRSPQDFLGDRRMAVN